MQEHDIDVAERIELSASVAAQRDQGERAAPCAVLSRAAAVTRRVKTCRNKHIDEFDSPGANFPSASSGLMFQAQPMFFDLEELLVEGQDSVGRRAPVTAS